MNWALRAASSDELMQGVAQMKENLAHLRQTGCLLTQAPDVIMQVLEGGTDPGNARLDCRALTQREATHRSYAGARSAHLGGRGTQVQSGR
jgi:hypothetical protein